MMVQRRPRTAIRIAALLLLTSFAATHAQDPAALLARLETADSISAIDDSASKPWHLKMTVQLFDEKNGKLTDEGTIEEWWSAPGIDRREYKTNAYTATEIRNADSFYRTKDEGSPLYMLELLREQAVHPLPKVSEIEHSTPELRKVQSGKITLDCIMLSQPLKQTSLLPLGLFPTYCFNSGEGMLRASFEFGQQTVTRNGLASFQSRVVAKEVTVLSERTKVASSQIVTLEQATVPDSQFAVSDDLTQQHLGSVMVSSGTVAGMALKQEQPRYPQSAKDRHASGVVVMRALIGTDGHIHSLSVVSGPDPDLAIAAIAAVRKWVYKPYLLLGVPTEVQTTINVNFTFGPG